MTASPDLTDRAPMHPAPDLQQPGEGRLAHAAPDHPPLPAARIGVILANLGTPDATDYWSMRRYLNEFLSDQRVIDYPRWLWQPLLQAVILSKRPFTSGANYRKIWNKGIDESPLLHHHPRAGGGGGGADGGAARRPGGGGFRHALRQPRRHHR